MTDIERELTDIEQELERERQIERSLQELTGLTLAQYRALQYAGVGALRHLGAATKHYLCTLIGPDLRCTADGHKMLAYIEELARRDWYIGPGDAVEINGSKPGLPKRGPTIRLRPVHWKLIGALYNAGGLSERWIIRIYGAQALQGLLFDDLVDCSEKPDVAGWRVCRLTAAGNRFAQELGA